MSWRLVCVVALIWQSAILIGQQAIQVTPERGSLSWWAQQARSPGKSAITLGQTIYEYGRLESLDAAFRRHTVVVATLLQTASGHTGNEIFTIRKYKILERLTSHQRPLPPDSDQYWRGLPAFVPKSMLPLAKDEFITTEGGGTVTIGGVQITDPGEGLQKLPTGSRYLMFLLFDSTQKVGLPNYGPIGLFVIDDSNALRARLAEYEADRSNPLLHQIRQRTNGRFERFRIEAAALKPQ